MFRFLFPDQHLCEKNNGGCLQTCTDNVNGHFCGCYDGYTLSEDLKSCTGKDHQCSY